MTRLLLLLLIAAAVWLLLEWSYRGLMRALGRDPKNGRRAVGRGSGRPPAGGEALVACDACGAYVPASRALPAARGSRACSEACRARLRS